MNEELPPPLEGGRVAQTAVEYLGPRAADFSHRGLISGRLYHFAQLPQDRWAWVLAEDLERFSLLSDYLVHEEHSIDPIRDAERARDQRIETLERKLAEALQPKLPDRPRRGGRPRVPDDRCMQAWHLHHHCGWPWRAVAEYQGIEGWKPETTVQQTASRWATRNPRQGETTECVFCRTTGCPPMPS